MYFSCQMGNLLATKIVSFFGFFGSKVVVFPLDIFLVSALSAELMFEDVERMYAMAGESDGEGAGTSG